MAPRWTSIEVGLVLQGGGALGAYEWGAIEALFEVIDDLERTKPVSLKVVTGVSIGAINGACIVGANGKTEKERRTDGLDRLAKLWTQLTFNTPFKRDLEFRLSGLPGFVPARDISLIGLPGFYVPRMDFWNFWKWTNFYTTDMLEKTLKACVCFDAINASDMPTTFVVTAVDVEKGTLRRFRNKPKPTRVEPERAEEKNDPVVFEPRHILASGSLAPQFPWTEIDDALYWDGGLVDNTPLGDAIDALSDAPNVYRLIVVMNLYPLTGRKPQNLLEVADRVHELSFGNRMRQDRASARRVNDLVKAVEALSGALAKAKIAPDAKLTKVLDDVRDYKVAKTIELDLQKSAAQQNPEDDEAGLRDFSPETVATRRRRGHERARADLIAELRNDGFLTDQAAA